MANVLDFFIRAKDKTGAATKGAGKGFRSMAVKIVAVVVAIKAAIASFKMLGRVIKDAIQEAMKIEAAKNPFIRFTGSAKAAREHIEELRKLSRFGLFNLDEFIDASRKLMNISHGALGGAQNMKSLADAATTTGEELGKVTDTMGRFLAYLTAERDVTTMAIRLQNLGVVTGEATEKIKSMVETGAPFAEIWGVVTKEIDKFKGGLEDDSELAIAAIGKLKDQGKEALGKLGKAFLEQSGLVRDLGNFIQRLMDEGKLDEWAEKAAGGLESLIEVAKATSMVIAGITDKINQLKGAAIWLTGGVSDKALKKTIEGMAKPANNPFLRQDVESLKDIEERAKRIAGIEERNKIRKQLEVAQASKDKKKLAEVAKEQWNNEKKAVVDFYEKQKSMEEKAQQLKERGLQKEATQLQKIIDFNKEKYEVLRKMVVDPEFRESQKGEAKEAAKEERRYRRTLGRARRKISQGGMARLSETERFALEAEGAKGIAEIGAGSIEERMLTAEESSAERLKSIDEKIANITAMGS